MFFPRSEKKIDIIFIIFLSDVVSRQSLCVNDPDSMADVFNIYLSEIINSEAAISS